MSIARRLTPRLWGLLPPIFSLFDACPAVYYALSVLTGISLYHGYYLPLLTLFLQPPSVRSYGFILILCVTFGYIYHTAPTPLPNKTFSGTGYLHIERIQNAPYGKASQVLCTGTIRTFITEDQDIYYDIPIRFTKGKKEILSHHTDYLIQGTRTKTDDNQPRIKLHTLKPIENTRSLASHRYTWKQKGKKCIHSFTEDRYLRALYIAFATGDIEYPLLSFLFNRMGLQHALAISGFHYAILTLCLAFFLRRFFSLRTTAIYLLLFCSAYLFFMGNTPSLCRAYVALVIYLAGYILFYRTSALNAWGLSALISLLLDPSSLFSIGFQLSYVATFALLTFTTPLYALFKRLFPQRKPSDIKALPLLDKLALLILHTFGQWCSVNFAINLVLLPLLLYHFQSFPLWSLVYNLFIPPLLSVTLILLICTFLLWPLAPLLVWVNNLYTTQVLQLLLYTPNPVLYSIRIRDIPIQLVISSLILFLLLGLIYKELERQSTHI